MPSRVYTSAAMASTSSSGGGGRCLDGQMNGSTSTTDMVEIVVVMVEVVLAMLVIEGPVNHPFQWGGLKMKVCTFPWSFV